MSISMDYKKCKLVSMSKSGNKAEMVSWLPLPFCKKGKNIKLKNSKLNWEVKKVYSIRLKEYEVLRSSESYKNQREVSDI